MADVIIMPKLGFNMSEGKLVKWYKNIGEAVTKGEPVFAIETDKTSIDIEATADGVFRIKFIEEGEAVGVTLPIAIIGDESENIDALVKEAKKQLNREDKGSVEETQDEVIEPSTTKATVVEKVAKTMVGNRLKITPRARKKAGELGISLDGLAIEGTGYDGGICEKDVIEYATSNRVKISPVAHKIANEMGIELDSVQGSGANGKIMKRDITASVTTIKEDVVIKEMKEEVGSVQISEDGKEILEIVPYSGVRKIIGERLAQSKFTAPHLYFTQKVNLDKLLELRAQVNAAQDKKTSVTDYIAKAVIICLQKYPEMNESLVGDQIIKYKSVNLGIAVAAPTGLIVPVVKNANKLSVVEISKGASELFEKARNGKLTPAEYTGGTFTISNLGMFGIENFTAIINPPEVGILAVSATKDEPLVVKDENGNKVVAIKPMMNINLTVDHRVIDGLLAAQFVTDVKKLLETPINLLV